MDFYIAIFRSHISLERPEILLPQFWRAFQRYLLRNTKANDRKRLETNKFVLKSVIRSAPRLKLQLVNFINIWKVLPCALRHGCFEYLSMAQSIPTKRSVYFLLQLRPDKYFIQNKYFEKRFPLWIWSRAFCFFFFFLCVNRSHRTLAAGSRAICQPPKSQSYMLPWIIHDGCWWKSTGRKREETKLVQMVCMQSWHSETWASNGNV